MSYGKAELKTDLERIGKISEAIGYLDEKGNYSYPRAVLEREVEERIKLIITAVELK